MLSGSSACPSLRCGYAGSLQTKMPRICTKHGTAALPLVLHPAFCLVPSAFASRWSVMRSPLIPFQLSTFSVSAFPLSSVNRLQALLALSESLVVALGSHGGGLRDAWGWLWGGYRLASNTHGGGFDVASRWL